MRKYDSTSSSTGKKPTVAPYSGAMLLIVARSANGRRLKPSPKYSTNLPTTPWRPQHLRNRQHQVSGRRAFRQLADEPHADDFRE